MLTRAGKKALALKLSDRHVQQYMSEIEFHLHKHIEELQEHVREADNMFYEKVNELADMEEYADRLNDTLRNNLYITIIYTFISSVSMAYLGYNYNC